MQSFVVSLFAAQKDNQDYFRISADFSIGFGCFLKVGNSLLFTATQASHGHRYFYRPRQTAHHVVVRAHDQLGFGVAGVHLQHLLVIMACPYCIPQCGEPGTLNQCGIGSEFSPGYAACVDGINVTGIGLKLFGFQLFCAINQITDALFYILIGWSVGLRDEAVIGIFAGVHRAHAIELLKKDGNQQVVYREGVIGMPLQDLIELLDRAVVVHVVKVVERLDIKRVVWTICSFFGGLRWGFGRSLGVSRQGCEQRTP